MMKFDNLQGCRDECAALYRLHHAAIAEYQQVFDTKSDPGVVDAARKMREEIERLSADNSDLRRKVELFAIEAMAAFDLQREYARLRAALIRWHRANETRDFIAADDAIAAIAEELAKEAT